MKHWFVQWLHDQSEQEPTATHFREWSSLAEDLISVGLEDVALDYYDAKREEQGLPPRPAKKTVWNFDGILPHLERQIRITDDSKALRHLKEIHIALGELLDTDMDRTVLAYYLRSILNYPELNLPAPKMQVVDL